MNDQPLLRVAGLKKHFASRGQRAGPVLAVDGVDFDLAAGETLGIVGESGCGKSTLGRALLRLIEPTAGTVWFEGDDIGKLNRSALAALRKKMQMIFQDPFASLDPRFTIARTLAEPLRIHRQGSAAQQSARVAELLETVGLAQSAGSRYPHEFSGGQRQRIAIARAIALGPKLIVADEPVSALDVSIQAQIINLLADLREQLNLGYVFISHDLAVVEHISERVAVMYLGRIVELTTAKQLFESPAHPYTHALIGSIPNPDPGLSSDREPLLGEPPDPSAPPQGCPFHPRCPQVMSVCREQPPPLAQVGGALAAHSVRCHIY